VKHQAPFKVALLGWDHPHAPLLLRSLQNLGEVRDVYIWNDAGGRLPPPPVTGKVRLIASNLAALLAVDGLGFAIVCTRTSQLFPVARTALAAGLPLLVEKPAGLTSREVARLAEIAERSQTPFAVFFGQRTHPAVRDAKRQIGAGLLGRLLTVEAKLLTTQVQFRSPQSWLFRHSEAGGGILTWLGSHYLDLIPHLLEDPIVAVSARLATRSGEHIDVEDTAALTLEFQSGAIGTFHLGYILGGRGSGYNNPHGFESQITCNGHTGRVAWRGTTSRSLVWEDWRGSDHGRHRGRYRLPLSDSYGGPIGDLFFRHFFSALKGEREMPATLRDAERVLKIIEAARRSHLRLRQEKV